MRGFRRESGVGRALGKLRGWEVERTRVEEREEETETERLFVDEGPDSDDGGNGDGDRDNKGREMIGGNGGFGI